jgi:hypothetical protein
MRLPFGTGIRPFRLTAFLESRYARWRPSWLPRDLQGARTGVVVGATVSFSLLAIVGAVALTAGSRSTGSTQLSLGSSLGAHAQTSSPFTSSSAQPTVSPTNASPSAAVPVPSPHTLAGCYPQSDEGTCYEPGDVCSNADRGATGVAGDGEQIVCEDADGWRWEPASPASAATSAAPSSPARSASPTPSPSPTPTPSPSASTEPTASPASTQSPSEGDGASG